MFLRKNGKVIGAVEIFVSHSLEPEKEEYLSLSIPWIEFDAQEILSMDDNRLNHDQKPVLVYKKINKNVFSKWICTNCKNDIEKQQKKKERSDNSEQYQITAFRIIDFFYPNQKRYRSVFYATKRIKNLKTTEIRIEDLNEIVFLLKPGFTECLELTSEKIQ